MAAKKNKKKVGENTIAVNRKARHEFFIEDKFEAGLVLEGWEVKSLRDGKVQLNESYVHVRNGEAWLANALITALQLMNITDQNRQEQLLGVEYSEIIKKLENHRFNMTSF